jgi:hypothetical protein
MIRYKQTPDFDDLKTAKKNGLYSDANNLKKDLIFTKIPLKFIQKFAFVYDNSKTLYYLSAF